MAFSQWLRAALSVFGVSMLPVLELKASIPLGISLGLPLWETFLIALFGSTLPVPFLLLFLRPVFRRLRRYAWFARFADWFEARTQKKTDSLLSRYRGWSLLGLFMFVAVPLPTTGVWTGSAIASALDLRIAYALPVILVGNAVAGLLMLSLGMILV